MFNIQLYMYIVIVYYNIIMYMYNVYRICGGSKMRKIIAAKFVDKLEQHFIFLLQKNPKILEPKLEG